VPWSGNVAWFLGNLIGSPVDSMLRRASWLALLTAVFGIVFCAVALLFDQPASPMALRVYVFSLFMLLAGYWFVLIPLIEWLRREVFGSPSWSWRKVAIVAVACLLFLAPGLAFGLIMASMVQIRTSLVELLPLLGLTWAFSAIPLVHLARVADGQVRHYREWAGLEIG
jgi:hypothetical protein